MLIYLYSLTQLYPNAACPNQNEIAHRNSMLAIAISISIFPLGIELESVLQIARLHSEGKSSLAVIVLGLDCFLSHLSL